MEICNICGGGQLSAGEGLVIAVLFGEGCFAGLSARSVPFLYIGLAGSLAELFAGFMGFE